MTPIIGHESVLLRLMQHHPRVMLFVGPASVGKHALAMNVAQQHDPYNQHTLDIQKLDIAAARGASKFAAVGSGRVVIVCLDGATDAAANALLKVIEESSARFILLAESMPSDTVMSRAVLFRFSLLTDEQVEDILLARGIVPSEAKRLAELAHGTLRNVLHARSDSKSTVLAAMTAIRNRDEDALGSLVHRWSDEHTELMVELCVEAITEKWSLFDHAEVEGTPREVYIKLLTALSRNIRPRFVVHASLMSVLRGE